MKRMIVTYVTELDENGHNMLVKDASYDSPCDSLRNPGLVAEVLNSVFKLNKKAEEYVYMIAVDAKTKPLGVFEISHGAVNSSFCGTREIFIRALLCGASGIILAHNHPSGDVKPSKEDMAVYRKVKEAGKLIGVDLLDSVIVGDGYFSFNENEE